MCEDYNSTNKEKEERKTIPTHGRRRCSNRASSPRTEQTHTHSHDGQNTPRSGSVCLLTCCFAAMTYSSRVICEHEGLRKQPVCIISFLRDVSLSLPTQRRTCKCRTSVAASPQGRAKRALAVKQKHRAPPPVAAEIGA